MKDVDPAFQQGVGHQVGLEIWQIENSQPRAVQKQQYGKFCTDRSYIILQTCSLLTGTLHHHIHYWHGRCSNQNDAAVAAIKAVELNVSLGGSAIQEREMEGYESERFLSYFKPCFIPFPQDLNGDVKDIHYQTRMYICKGRHVAHVKEVPFTRSSLSHEDIFILDTAHKIFQFNGANTDTYERTKALDVVQYLMDNFHKEKCKVAIIEDGKFVADVDSGEFWGLFGGFAPLMKKMENGNHEVEWMGSTLHTILDGQTGIFEASPLRREMLDANKTYILECDKEVFIWMGHNTSLQDRKAAVLVAEDLSTRKRKPHETKLLCVNEDFEPVEFRLNFLHWPINKKKCFQEGGRQKVAALLKQKGFNVQGLIKPVPGKEKLQLISSIGKLQVWCIKGGSKECLPQDEFVKIHTNNCYVVFHSCQVNQKKEHFVYTWLSHQTTMETRAAAAYHVKDIAGSFEENAVEVQIFQGKEPDQFFSLFNKLIIIKDSETEGKGSLFQMYSSDASKWHAVQVNLVAASLNSSSCFFLQTGDRIFIWYGKFTTLEEQEATKSMVHHFKPDANLTAFKEGAETQSFWSTLGGRQTYQSHHEPTECARKPRLFSCALLKDQFKVIEVFNFTQEDLLSDEIMILDCYTSVFIWVGEATSTQNKLRAPEFGQKYLELMAKNEGNSLETPTYKIHEGCEPFLFTSLFDWNSTKVKHYLNPFERKALAMKGESTKQTEQVIKSKKLSPALNGKGFQLIPDKARNSQKVTFKPEHPMNKFRQPKSKTGHAPTASKSAAVSAFSTMFELPSGREAPPNTPIVKLPALSLKPKGPMKESPPPTPCSRTTPKPSISPAIASLTSVYESYNDRFAFAWPGMKLRHEERALSRDVDTFSFETFETTVEEELEQEPPAISTQADVDMEDGEEEQAYYPYERLKASSSNPVLHIDRSKRESYLSSQEFEETFLMDKDTFYKLPRWKQDKYKKLFDLF
eukprot:c24614_g1_i1 orf=232-3150(+)